MQSLQPQLHNANAYACAPIFTIKQKIDRERDSWIHYSIHVQNINTRGHES